MNGTLDLTITPQFEKNLLFPNSQNLADLSSFLNEGSFDLTTIPTINRKVACMWVLKHCDALLKSLIWNGTLLEADNFDDLLSVVSEELQNLGELKCLVMNNLGLGHLHDLSTLQKITSVDYSNNEIKAINYSNLPPESLQSLSLSGNPMVEYGTDICGLPALTQLSLGSSETKYICYPLLEKALTSLRLSVDESCSTSLLYPSFDVVSNKAKLREFVDRRELTLKAIDFQEKEHTMNWLLTECGVNFKSLHLCDEKLFLSETQLNLSQIFSKSKVVANLTEIYLANCGLETMPGMSPLSELTIIDISNNEISELNEEFLPKSIQQLLLEGNPIPYVQIKCSLFPRLTRFRCGSQDTHYISTQILEKVLSSGFELEVPEDYEKYLDMPPSSVLNDKEGDLMKYVQNPEIYLMHINSIDKRTKALFWLFDSDNPSPSGSLDFTSQTWLSKTKLDTKKVNLWHIRHLILKSCGLKELPGFSDMSQLKCLDLCSNFLTNVDIKGAFSLESLDISQNSIEEIDFEVDSFPHLSMLSFGSEQTRFVNFRILNKARMGKLDLWVPEKYRSHLLSPTWSILRKGATSIRNYMTSSALQLWDMPDGQSRLRAIQWHLDRNLKFMTIFDLSDLGDILKKENLSETFERFSFGFVTELYLSNCGLQAIPDWSNLKQLKYADVSCNKLVSVPSSSSIQILDVTNNLMPLLCFDKENFPKLTTVKAGSPSLNFIMFKVLKTLLVQIHDSYKDSLILPPSFCS